MSGHRESGKKWTNAAGHLHAVSADRKTVISSHPDGIAIWDVPAKPSWRTAAMAIGGWTGLWLVTSFTLMATIRAAQRIRRGTDR